MSFEVRTAAATALALTTAVMALAVAGCDAPLAAQQIVYQTCGGAEPHCGDGSLCVHGVIGSVAQCTRECVEDDDCPGSAIGRPRCRRFVDGSYCVLACTEDEDCASGTSCEDLETVGEEEVSLCAG